VAGRCGFSNVAILAALCLFAPQIALCQAPESAVLRGATGTGVTKTPPVKQAAESEIAETNMIGYGSRKIFGAGERCNLWAAGVEYDRHMWGHFLKARMDYVAEVLPVVVLKEPVVTDIWGNSKSEEQQLVYGVGVTPIGLRMLWRSNKAVRPFMVAKVGALIFSSKVLSSEGSAANLAFQGDFGLEVKLTQRMDLRVAPFEYFHFSNGYFAASNPGVDVISAKFGISYQLGGQGR
jgi:hypothetical protein